MKIMLQDHDDHVQVHFGRRAGVCLEPFEAEVLRQELSSYLAGEPRGDWPDVGVYVMEGTYAEDHVEVHVGSAWFEITIDEATELKEALDVCLVSS